MEKFVTEVENILNYQFKNSKLLEQALTHGSSAENSASYDRLEFVGDAALSIAVTNHFFFEYPLLDSGKLSLVRSANVSTEKLARAAVRSGLHRSIKHNSLEIHSQVRDFVRAVSMEDETVVHGGAVRAPKILADIVESVAAAVYLDSDLDCKLLWKIMKPVLEPIVKPEFLKEQPQPVSAFYELCQKQGLNFSFKQTREGGKSLAKFYVNGKVIGSGSSKQQDNAKFKAATEALQRLSIPAASTASTSTKGICRIEIDDAKRKLKELCDRNQWPTPIYKIVTEEGLPHDKRFICSVKIDQTGELVIGETRPRVKDAENSAAFVMLHTLAEQKSHI